MLKIIRRLASRRQRLGAFSLLTAVTLFMMVEQLSASFGFLRAVQLRHLERLSEQLGPDCDVPLS